MGSLAFCCGLRIFAPSIQIICVIALVFVDGSLSFACSQVGLVDTTTQRETAQLARIASKGFEIAAKAGPPGEPVAIQFTLPAVVIDANGQPNTPRFLIFRGLPDQFSFSSGFRVRQSWVVSVKDLDRLQMIYPPNFAGTLQLEAVLHGPESMPLLNTSIAIQINAPIIKPSQAHETAAVQGDVRAGRPQPSIEQPVKPKWDDAEQARLLERGQGFMTTGNIAAARMVLEQLVASGNATAAFAMGQSYDPEFLRRMNVIGSLPDASQARKWYRKAAELGSKQANDRLSVLAE